MNKNVDIDIEKFVDVSKAFSDSNRVRAFMVLRNGELCVCQLIALLKLAPSTVSKHMAILKQAGLVDCRKDSRWVYYRIAETNHNAPINDIIALSIALLKKDAQIVADDSKMIKIVCEGLADTCKDQ